MSAVDSSLIADKSVGSRQVGGTQYAGDALPPEQTVVEFDMTETPSLAEVVHMEKIDGPIGSTVEVEVVQPPLAPPSSSPTRAIPEVVTPPAFTHLSAAPPSADTHAKPSATDTAKVATKEKDKEKDKVPLTVAELQALSDLTQVSAVCMYMICGCVRTFIAVLRWRGRSCSWLS